MDYDDAEVDDDDDDADEEMARTCFIDGSGDSVRRAKEGCVSEREK